MARDLRSLIYEERFRNYITRPAYVFNSCGVIYILLRKPYSFLKFGIVFALPSTSTKKHNNKTMATRNDLWYALIDEIIIDKDYNVREDMGDLEELLKSMTSMDWMDESKRENGNPTLAPIHVYKSDDQPEKFVLISGHRRIAAAKLGVSRGVINPATFRIPMIKVKKPKPFELAMGLITYNEGKPLNMLERANAYQKALDADPTCTVATIADRLGKSPTAISNCLRLLKAEPETKELITKGLVAPTQVQEMLKKRSAADVNAELKEAIRLNGNRPAQVGSVFPSVNLFPTSDKDMEDSEIPASEDNVKTTGASGMDLQLSDSGNEKKLTKKNLTSADEKVKTYTKDFILKLLVSYGVTPDEQAYVVLYENL